MQVEESFMVNMKESKAIRTLSKAFVFFILGYDGPLHYTMVNDNNPDQVISILPSPDSIDGNFFYFNHDVK